MEKILKMKRSIVLSAKKRGQIQKIICESFFEDPQVYIDWKRYFSNKDIKYLPGRIRAGDLSSHLPEYISLLDCLHRQNAAWCETLVKTIMSRCDGYYKYRIESACDGVKEVPSFMITTISEKTTTEYLQPYDKEKYILITPKEESEILNQWSRATDIISCIVNKLLETNDGVLIHYSDQGKNTLEIYTPTLFIDFTPEMLEYDANDNESG